MRWRPRAEDESIMSSKLYQRDIRRKRKQGGFPVVQVTLKQHSKSISRPFLSQILCVWVGHVWYHWNKWLHFSADAFSFFSTLASSSLCGTSLCHFPNRPLKTVSVCFFNMLSSVQDLPLCFLTNVSFILWSHCDCQTLTEVTFWNLLLINACGK